MSQVENTRRSSCRRGATPRFSFFGSRAEARNLSRRALQYLRTRTPSNTRDRSDTHSLQIREFGRSRRSHSRNTASNTRVRSKHTHTACNQEGFWTKRSILQPERKKPMLGPILGHTPKNNIVWDGSPFAGFLFL